MCSVGPALGARAASDGTRRYGAMPVVVPRHFWPRHLPVATRIPGGMAPPMEWDRDSDGLATSCQRLHDDLSQPRSLC